MFSFAKFAAVAAISALPGIASAASTYDVTNYNATTGLWTDNMVQKQGGGRAGDAFSKWSLSNGHLSIDDNGVARMTGKATNHGDGAIGLNFVLDMKIDPDSTNTGYCQYGGAPFDCVNGNRSNAPFDTSAWTYLDMLGGTLTGTGEMSGIVLKLSDVTNGKHLPQMGVGANAFDKGDLGFSSWLSWVSADGSTDNSTKYDFLGSSANSNNKHLDFNVDLAVMPLPAGAPLLIAGLGVLGFVRSRRKAA